MSGVDYYGAGFDYAFFYRDFHGLSNQQIQKVLVLEAQLAELTQRTGVYNIGILGSHAEKIFERHVITRPFHNIDIGYVIDCFQQKIFEHHHRTFSHPAVVLTVFVHEFLLNEREVDEVIDPAKKIVLRDNQVVEIAVITELKGLLKR